MPDDPHGAGACQCFFCEKCQSLHMTTDGEEKCPPPFQTMQKKEETVVAKQFTKADIQKAVLKLEGMSVKPKNGEFVMHGFEVDVKCLADLMTPGGLKIEDKPVKPCPECGGEASKLKQCHKMSCDGHFTLCPVCDEWSRVWPDGGPHVCNKKSVQPRLRPAFDIPPRKRPNRWFIEWRWKSTVCDEKGPMPPWMRGWEPHTSRYPKGAPTECMARTAVQSLRKQCPEKSFRYRRKFV